MATCVKVDVFKDFQSTSRDDPWRECREEAAAVMIQEGSSKGSPGPEVLCWCEGSRMLYARIILRAQGMAEIVCGGDGCAKGWDGGGYVACAWFWVCKQL